MNWKKNTQNYLNKKLFPLKVWFRYLVYKAKNINFKQLIFLDFKTLGIFAALIVINILFNLSEIGFPEEFPSLENCINILETLVRTVVVLLSIIFSFTLLSFQIFNKYFGRFAFFDFFKKKHLKIMFTLFILNVLFLIYTIGYLKTCQVDNYFRPYGKILFVEAVIFSIALTVSIFPVMINLLSHSQSRSNLKNLFNSINDENIMSFSTFLDQEIDEDEYETNIFKIINEIGLVAVKDFDQTTFEIVIRSIYLKAKEIFESDKSNDVKRNLYYNFCQNLKDFFSYAVKEKNSIALLRLLTIRFIIEREVIKHTFLQDFQEEYKGWDFNYDIEDYFSRTIQHNEDAASAQIIDVYRDFFREIIKVKFPSSFNYNFDKPYDNLNATNIVSTNYGVIENFIKNAGTTKKPLILKSLSNLFTTLDLEIIGGENTANTKSYLLQINNFHKIKFVKALVEDAQIKNIEFQYYPFGISNTSEITKLKSTVILRSQIDNMDYLFQKNVVNNLVLNELKAAAFSIISDLSEDVALGEKILSAIIKKFDYLRSLIKITDTSDRKDLYINLHRYLTYIKSGYTEKGIDYKVGDLLNEVIGNFEYLEDFKKNLEDEGYIQNTNLF